MEVNSNRQMKIIGSARRGALPQNDSMGSPYRKISFGVRGVDAIDPA